MAFATKLWHVYLNSSVKFKMDLLWNKNSAILWEHLEKF
jgi:hypothetical protein